jgi:UTP:GlnB (protein PII) uridylyltransferase
MGNLLEFPSKEEAFGGRLAAHPELDKAWNFTAERLHSVAMALAEVIPKYETPRIALFIAGSYGRFEAGPPSDADRIIVYEAEPNHPKHLKPLVEAIQQVFLDHGIAAPNPKGVFATQYALSTLIESAGSHTENVEAFPNGCC